MSIVEVKNLTFSYDGTKTNIDDVSFAVEEGTYTTIVGHNGSGNVLRLIKSPGID